jgi:hypothetical protein
MLAAAAAVEEVTRHTVIQAGLAGLAAAALVVKVPQVRREQ